MKPLRKHTSFDNVFKSDIISLIGEMIWQR